MIDPAWFFSTISQSIAAAIGFVIAFTASIYTVRQSRIRERIGRLQHDVAGLHEKFALVLDSMLDEVRRHGDFQVSEELENRLTTCTNRDSNNAVQEHTEEWSRDQDTPELAYIWANMRIISSRLSAVPSSDNPSQIFRDFRFLEQIIKNVIGRLDWQDHDIIELFEEITDEDSTSINSVEGHSIFKGTDNQARQILKESSLGNPQQYRSIRGWYDLFRQLDREYTDIRNRNNVEIFASRSIDPTISVLRRSLHLFVFGVIFPLVFLVTIPSEILGVGTFVLDGFGLSFIQIGILTLVLFESYRLFQALNDLIRGEPI